MKALTTLVAGLALLLVASVAVPSTTSAASVDTTPQDLSGSFLLGFDFWEDCYIDEVEPRIGVTDLQFDVLPGDIEDSYGPIVDPCRPWDTPCEINPNFPICQPEDEPTPGPTLPPVILDICYNGVFYPDADVAGVDPSIYTVGECVDEEPTAEPTEAPTEVPTEEPTEEAPPPAETGNGGLASTGGANTWGIAALTLVLSSMLGAGALAVVRR